MGYSKDNSRIAKEAATEALAQAQRAELAAKSVTEVIAESEAVTAENKIIPLATVATVALRNSTYPNPQHGSLVSVTQGANGNAETYRFVIGTGWVFVDQYNGTTITNLTQHVAEKIAKGQVKISDINKNYGLIDETYLSDTLKAQITGTTSIGNTPANNSITPVKTTFFKTGKNLFDKSTAHIGQFINESSGALNANASYSSSDYISVIPNTQYAAPNSGGAGRIAYYDANKVFILGTFPKPVTHTTPANCYYVRYSFYASELNTQQFELGSVLTSYEAFMRVIPKEMLETKEFTLASIPSKSLTEEKMKFLIPGKNLFNKSTIEVGKYINWNNGLAQGNQSYSVTDFIPVLPDTQYTRTSILHYAWYDENKVFISGNVGTNATLSSPSNARYFRQSIYLGSEQTFQFEKGAVATPYEPFIFYLDGVSLNPALSGEETVIINLPSKIHGIVGQELNIYFDNIISGKDTNYEFDVTCAKGKQFADFFRINPDVAETLTINIIATKNGKVVATKTSSLLIKASSVGTGVTKSVIVIGDSTTNNGIAVSKLNANFDNDPMNVVSLGTRGVSPNKHEGRSGWTARQFVSIPSTDNGTVVNSFYNSATASFDFSYYLTTHSIAKPDYVIINLGINDTFGQSSDEGLEIKANEIIADYDKMISSIHSHDTSIKLESL